MKIFWSWQSDTPGKTGRHFVRKVLADAVGALKGSGEIDEPTDRETREALHLDHDRQGVPGSPDLAATILAKIAVAAVFVADVTLVGSVDASPTDDGADGPKRLINANVAIEYGFALCGLTDAAILMVQNTYYGGREGLPFDLRHKAGPIQYCLAPEATKVEIEAEAAKFRGKLISELRACLAHARPSSTTVTTFQETATTTNIATFWEKSEAIASYENTVSKIMGRRSDDDFIEYRFPSSDIFYLRLIPTKNLVEPLAITKLMDIVDQRSLRVLTRSSNGMPSRNRFGVVAYEAHGTSTSPIAFSQLFRNGEIWGVTNEFFVDALGKQIVPMENVFNVYNWVAPNFLRVASEGFKIPGPFHIELGAVGLTGWHLTLPRPSLNHDISDRIFEPQLRVRATIDKDVGGPPFSIVQDFVCRLYDLAGVVLPPLPTPQQRI